MTISANVSVVNGVIQPIDPIHVPAGGTQTIQWNVITPPWVFPPNGTPYTGIVITGGDGQFTSQGPSADGKQFTYGDSNQLTGQYKYSVTLVQPGGAPIYLDPLILNHE
jgi:hypothetical protein